MPTLAFHPVSAPITAPITKLGGQPFWLASPQWPLSRSTGEPMRFVAQVCLPAALRRGGKEMVYIFMTDPDDDVVDGTWEPGGGENAVILQPAAFEPIVRTCTQATGPTLRVAKSERNSLYRKLMGYRPPRRLIPTELAVTEQATPPVPGEFTSRIGGEPEWLQNDDTPPGGPWHLILQIDSTEELYEVNFGDGGVGYAFIRADGRQGRFLWQSL